MDKDTFEKRKKRQDDQDNPYNVSEDYYVYENPLPIPLPVDRYTNDDIANMMFRERGEYSYENYKYMSHQPFQNSTLYNTEPEFSYQYQPNYQSEMSIHHSENIQPVFEYYSTPEGEVFLCGIPGCNKKYRTKNGIMYHRKVGCKFEDDEKRFVCKYEGCNNKYRGASGLRYHLIHYHNEVPKKNKD
ncbi:hypothetical protein TUBRATIS_002060 [Tubulinosema ratisbonensis]|uniref:C2H2-type domain-containing protein n=1 Tax=Tubulinosema ratisbonensis TaxID=291195 RepID=A0A437AQI0_9MICR|nr:hypothetical protein TUBRATIS_002060 [Tubulinosema ratisbonensis]